MTKNKTTETSWIGPNHYKKIKELKRSPNKLFKLERSVYMMKKFTDIVKDESTDKETLYKHEENIKRLNYLIGLINKIKNKND